MLLIEERSNATGYSVGRVVLEQYLDLKYCSRTYIGSTPSPPRRIRFVIRWFTLTTAHASIRQHNGEITQGAWKTKHNRPWVMQMIVYGFPSKLCALQFEWAWQHPHISRHLRGEDGKAVFQMNGKSRYLRTNVSFVCMLSVGSQRQQLSGSWCTRIARSMICSHPYNTWPLHVKLFTTEAEKAWNDSARDPGNAILPWGFTYTLELEGVDGKSGVAGTGRKGPIDVNDSESPGVVLVLVLITYVALSCFHLRARQQMDHSPGLWEAAQVFRMRRAYHPTTTRASVHRHTYRLMTLT